MGSVSISRYELVLHITVDSTGDISTETWSELLFTVERELVENGFRNHWSSSNRLFHLFGKFYTLTKFGIISSFSKSLKSSV